jgi:hypothetical protein
LSDLGPNKILPSSDYIPYDEYFIHLHPLTILPAELIIQHVSHRREEGFTQRAKPRCPVVLFGGHPAVLLCERQGIPHDIEEDRNTQCLDADARQDAMD